MRKLKTYKLMYLDNKHNVLKVEEVQRYKWHDAWVDAQIRLANSMINDLWIIKVVKIEN